MLLAAPLRPLPLILIVHREEPTGNAAVSQPSSALTPYPCKDPEQGLETKRTLHSGLSPGCAELHRPFFSEAYCFELNLRRFRVWPYLKGSAEYIPLGPKSKSAPPPLMFGVFLSLRLKDSCGAIAPP